MAGHSKWANIKHKKSAQDAKRGKIFTKLLHDITIAAKASGASLEDNPRLRSAIEKASAANVTKDTIQKAIDRASNKLDSNDAEELIYEGFILGSVAVVLQVLTDNRNRTAAEIRHLFSKYDSLLATAGSVTYLFEKVGQIVFDSNVDGNALYETALTLSVLDINEEQSEWILKTEVRDFFQVDNALRQAGFDPKESSIVMLPFNSIELADSNDLEKLEAFIIDVEMLDDVQEIYTNLC